MNTNFKCFVRRFLCVCVCAKRYSDKRYLKHATARNTTGTCCLKMYFFESEVVSENSGYVVNQLRITET